MALQIEAFFDEATNTISYLVADDNSGECLVIDSVLGFDHASGATSHEPVQGIVQSIRQRQWQLRWILETHVHADHLSAAPYLQETLGGQIGIGAGVTDIQRVFGDIFNEGNDFARDGRQFDGLLKQGDALSLGEFTLLVLHTPGHTPACVSYFIGDAVFVGDTLFMPDSGTARADFPGGDAQQLYQSIQRLLALPDNTRVFVCHDYKAAGRDEYAWQSTIKEQRERNIHVGNDVAEQDFVNMRQQRDAGLAMPKLIIPSTQVNMRAGHMPAPEANGLAYLKLPVNGFAKDKQDS